MTRRLFGRLCTVAVVAAAAACSRGAESTAQHASHASAPSAAPAGTAVVDKTPAPGPAPDGMVWVPGGTFYMGCADCGMPDAQPVHLVKVSGFWINRTPVTNAQFEKFVRETGYVTVAERPLDPKDFPGVPKDKLVPGSAVFKSPPQRVSLENPMQWWVPLDGASWRHPEGPSSGIKDRRDYPVVQIAYDDAVAYLKWAGRRLPTEAEFEFAARGGLDREPYSWGHDMKPGGRFVANIWQGAFPSSNSAADGYRGSSPVTAFPTNGFGLYDMGGNVWQWTADWYRPDYYATFDSAAAPPLNPEGPGDSFDPEEPGAAKRVVRGGSFLCSDQDRSRYLVGSRGKAEVSSGASNLGFRGVK